MNKKIIVVFFMFLMVLVINLIASEKTNAGNGNDIKFSSLFNGSDMSKNLNEDVSKYSDSKKSKGSAFFDRWRRAP